MKTNSTQHLITLVFALLSAEAAAQNILTNGSFELPGDAGTTDAYARYYGGTNAISGWLTTLNGVEYYDPSRSDFGTAHTFFGVAQDGAYIVDLAPVADSGGGIQQSFPTTVGQEYEVSFFMGTVASCGRDGTAFLQASAAGVTNSFGVTNRGSFIQWFPKSFAFTAAAASTTLAFNSTDNPELHFPLIHNVSVVPLRTNAVRLAIGLYPVIRIDGRAGLSYVIEYVESLTSTNWRELAYVTLPTSSYLWCDTTAPNRTDRFYRAIEIPFP